LHAEVPLTTVHVDKEFMGRLAVRRLHARLQGDPNGPTEKVSVRNVVPVSLIVRDSCRRV